MPAAPVAALADVLDRDPRVAYALVFGSLARGKAHRASDIDVAIGLVADRTLPGLDAGRLVSDLERATGRTVDVVLLHEAPPALAYRVFRDGTVVSVRDRSALVARRARAILDYLDYRPFEQAFVRGVLSRG